MVGKRVQFNDETWEAIEAVMRHSGSSFQDLTNEAFADLLKKHKQPVGLMAPLKKSVGADNKNNSLNIYATSHINADAAKEKKDALVASLNKLDLLPQFSWEQIRMDEYGHDTLWSLQYVNRGGPQR